MNKKLIAFALGTTALLSINRAGILRPLQALPADQTSDGFFLIWHCYLKTTNNYVGKITSDINIDGQIFGITEAEATAMCNNNVNFGPACENQCIAKPKH